MAAPAKSGSFNLKINFSLQDIKIKAMKKFPYLPNLKTVERIRFV